MQCDDPATGVDRVHLWVILLKVLASEACPHTHAMLMEHAATVSRMLTASDELPTISQPLVRLIRKCATWPSLLTLLVNKGAFFVQLLKVVHELNSEDLVADTCHALLAIFTSPAEVRRLGIEQHFEELIIQVLRVIRTGPSGSSKPGVSNDGSHSGAENLMFLGMTLLASLAAHEKALMIMRDRSYLDKAVVLKFMEVPYASVIGAFVSLLKNCCRVPELVKLLQQPEVVIRVVAHVGKATGLSRRDSDEILTQAAQLLYCFATTPNGLALLDDAAVEAIFTVVRRGPPVAQEVAIQAMYYLAVDAKTKRAIVRSGMLDLLCDLARNGPDRVQTHAAWVVSSLSVRGTARELMFEKNTLQALTSLLTAKNPSVATQAAWALSHLPHDSDTMHKFIGIGGIALISQTLSHEDRIVRAQGALTIGSLSDESPVFRSAIVDVGVVLMLVTLLSRAEDFETQLGIAVAVRAVAKTAEVAGKLLASGVGDRLVPLLRAPLPVRAHALAALVPLLSIPAEVPKLLAGPAMVAMLWGSNKEGDPQAAIDGQVVEVQNLVLKRSQQPAIELSLARCIRLLSSSDDAKRSFREASGFPVLVKLGESLEPDVQEEVAWAIGVLASDPESETLLAELGAVRSLLQYLRSGTEAVKKTSAVEPRHAHDRVFEVQRIAC
jgi:hypothetical protein